MNVSATEQLIGGGVLLLLIAVGLLVFKKGQLYDPSLYTVDEASLESTRTPVENKAGTLREEVSESLLVSGDTDESFEESYDGYDNDVSMGSGTSLSLSASSGHESLVSLQPYEGYSAMGELEVYSADTLYEKINGRAPAYIGFNFQELTFRTVLIEGQSGQYLDVFVYQMDTPVNAFGIFSMEREAGAESVDFVADGYRSDMGFFFRQGNTYVQVIASDVSEAVMAAAERFSSELASNIPEDDAGVGAAAMLPLDYQVPGSVSYIQEYAYGLEQLNDVFEARYGVDGVEFSFFGMASDSAHLKEAFGGVVSYFTDYGEVLERYEVNGFPVIVGDIFGQFSVVFLTEEAIGGVMNADSLEVPKAFVEQTLKEMEPNTGGLE